GGGRGGGGGGGAGGRGGRSRPRGGGFSADRGPSETSTIPSRAAPALSLLGPGLARRYGGGLGQVSNACAGAVLGGWRGGLCGIVRPGHGHGTGDLSLDDQPFEDGQLEPEGQQRQQHHQRHHQPAGVVVEQHLGDVAAEGLVRRARRRDADQVHQQADGDGAEEDDNFLVPRPADDEGDGGGQREEHRQHAQAVARLRDAEAQVVEEDDVALGDGGVAERLERVGRGQRRQALQRRRQGDFDLVGQRQHEEQRGVAGPRPAQQLPAARDGA